MLKFLDFVFLILYCTLIYWLSDQPTLPTPQLFLHQDKLIHAGAYFVMALLALRSFRHLTSSIIILTFSSIIFCSLYGISDEWHQSFVEGRVADVFDWLADTTGAIIAAAFYSQYRKVCDVKERA